jgi:hypothetical protein
MISDWPFERPRNAENRRGAVRIAVERLSNSLEWSKTGSLL